MTECVITTPPGQRCVSCPEVPYVAPVAAQTIVERIYGWNASAYSAQQLAGDCQTTFQVASSIGVVCGLAPERLSSDPRDVPHGFYCYEDSGRKLWAVSEAGATKTAPATWVPTTDEFRIERRNGSVSYFVNGRRVYASTVQAREPLRVVACMYASDDGVV